MLPLSSTSLSEDTANPHLNLRESSPYLVINIGHSHSLPQRKRKLSPQNHQNLRIHVELKILLRLHFSLNVVCGYTVTFLPLYIFCIYSDQLSIGS